MDDGDLKASMNALHREVTGYVTELEHRISQIEQNAIRQETQAIASLPTVTTAKRQLEEIKQAADEWENGQLEREITEVETQINHFLTEQLPATIEPLSKTLSDWKTKFNVSMINAGKRYQELMQTLDVDFSELEKASNTYSEQKKTVAQLSKDIHSVSASCDSLSVELQDMIDTQERELKVSLSGLAQQLQLDIMRAKAITNSTLSQSISNCQTSSLNEFFASLQGEVNAQCVQMEQCVREVQAMLDTSERQWQSDVQQLKDDIKAAITVMRPTASSEFALREKLEEAQSKIQELSERINNL